MSPSTTTHRGIEIRYDYDIKTDVYWAHFDLPEKPRKQATFQSRVDVMLSNPIEPGKHHVDGPIESEVLAQARSTIDAYLGEE
ncbi:MAG: hypothetical protein OJF61_001942 [Rhodanobacteraceae bacterium]|jgi:hypothetical protein|nr:MAG: hypothetical protein OJF61_001942 [Rhodanobacteraceae bacterium]